MAAAPTRIDACFVMQSIILYSDFLFHPVLTSTTVSIEWREARDFADLGVVCDPPALRSDASISAWAAWARALCAVSKLSHLRVHLVLLMIKMR